MTTPTADYNRIHALALARKKVFQKFGSNLLHFWPLSDNTLVFKDLARRRPLVGHSDVDLEQPGIVDYSIGSQSQPYVSDVGVKLSSLDLGSPNGYTSNYTAVVLPSGRVKVIQFDSQSGSAVTIHISLPGLDPSGTPPDTGLAVNKLMEVTTTVSGGAAPYRHTATLPASAYLGTNGEYWAYIRDANGNVQKHSVVQEGNIQCKVWNSGTSTWDDDNKLDFLIKDEQYMTWPTYDDFTVVCFVNAVEWAYLKNPYYQFESRLSLG